MQRRGRVQGRGEGMCGEQTLPHRLNPWSPARSPARRGGGGGGGSHRQRPGAYVYPPGHNTFRLVLGVTLDVQCTK